MVKYNPIDSRLLIKILVAITGKKPDPICKDLGLYNSWANYFRKGNPESCYWPRHKTWFARLWDECEYSMDCFPDEQAIPLEGNALQEAVRGLKENDDTKFVVKKFDLKDDVLAKQITLESKVYNYFISIRDIYFGCSEDSGKRVVDIILQVMQDNNVRYEDIEAVKSHSSYGEIVEFLVRRAASAKGTPLPIGDDGFHSDGGKIVYRHLSHKDILTPMQLKEIATLIWETDQYIFPAMFEKEQTLELLPIVLASNRDTQFSLDNIFAAFDQDHIIAIVLYKKGPLNWTSEYICKLAGQIDVELSDYLKKTENEYFSKYNSTLEDTIAILNFAIESNRKKQDIKKGGVFMRTVLGEFFKWHKEPAELYVLKETDVEMMAYLSSGFEIVKKCSGYSSDDRDLPCYFLRKENE